jgi:hypothetical protein
VEKTLNHAGIGAKHLSNCSPDDTPLGSSESATQRLSKRQASLSIIVNRCGPAAGNQIQIPIAQLVNVFCANVRHVHHPVVSSLIAASCVERRSCRRKVSHMNTLVFLCWPSHDMTLGSLLFLPASKP